MKSPTFIRADYIEYVRNSEHIPDEMRDLAEETVREYFQSISAALGRLELVVRRGKQSEGDQE